MKITPKMAEAVNTVVAYNAKTKDCSGQQLAETVYMAMENQRLNDIQRERQVAPPPGMENYP